MGVYLKVLSILVAVILFSHNTQASTCDSLSMKLMEQTWREFRSFYPFGFQTVGLKHYGDTCMFIISEPPCWVSQDSIKVLFTSYGGHVGIGKHTFGYDGELTDVIGCIILNATEFDKFEQKLFSVLYGTSYKPFYTNLDKPVLQTYCLPDTLCFGLSIEELFKIEQARLFASYMINDIKREKPIRLNIQGLQMFHFQSSALYYSKEPNYVVWIVSPFIAAKADSVFKSDARRFLLDTDLIIGVIPSSCGLAFIGRERQIPINVLPPLRAETIQLLAQQATDTLYTCFPADSTICVADTLYSTPVVLNESLKHSEIGNLMYQATGLLMTYANSHVYDYFAFSMKFPEAMPTNSYSSCWNPIFDGCLHSIALGEAECMYPMLYGDEDGSILEKASDSAYVFFAEQKSIDLIRLKQYAFIHEAFKMQSYFTNNSRDIQKNDYHEWIRVPTTIITNAPFANASFIM